MTNLKEYIKEKRPTLSDSSLTTYTSILKNLYKKVFNSDDIDIKKFDETDKILNHLKTMTPNKRKTILSSLVIITDKKAYRDLMLEDIKDYNKDIETQTKSESQKENWIETNQIKEVWELLKNDADLIYKKKTLKPQDLQQIQNFVIVSLLGGIFIPPRRSKDFVDFKIKEGINKEKDNFFEKNKLIYNSYKTSKTYGQQSVEIPRQLSQILKKWISVNPTNYLLFDTNFNPLSSVKLNQRLNKIFDERKISVNILRHSFLTDKYKKHIEEQKKMDHDMEEMGSSNKQATLYVKN